MADVSCGGPVRCRRGLLTITFTTPLAAGTEEWERLFDALVATSEATA